MVILLKNVDKLLNDRFTSGNFSHSQFVIKNIFYSSICYTYFLYLSTSTYKLIYTYQIKLYWHLVIVVLFD